MDEIIMDIEKIIALANAGFSAEDIKKIANLYAVSEPQIEPQAEPQIEPQTEPQTEPQIEPQTEPKSFEDEFREFMSGANAQFEALNRRLNGNAVKNAEVFSAPNGGSNVNNVDDAFSSLD